MSNETAKYLNSRRRHKTDVHIARQVKIAKAHGLTSRDKAIKEPHRLAKHHTMDCGNPSCYLCGNPRRHGEITITEKSFNQTKDWDSESDT